MPEFISFAKSIRLLAANGVYLSHCVGENGEDDAADQ